MATSSGSVRAYPMSAFYYHVQVCDVEHRCLKMNRCAFSDDVCPLLQAAYNLGHLYSQTHTRNDVLVSILMV